MTGGDFDFFRKWREDRGGIGLTLEGDKLSMSLFETDILRWTGLGSTVFVKVVGFGSTLSWQLKRALWVMVLSALVVSESGGVMSMSILGWDIVKTGSEMTVFAPVVSVTISWGDIFVGSRAIFFLASAFLGFWSGVPFGGTGVSSSVSSSL